jgi:hypothetical protein
VAFVVAAILIALSLLHVLWGIGGIVGTSAALPEVDGKPLFVPTRTACFAVALALAVAAGFVAWRGGLAPSPLSPVLTQAGCLAVGAVFVLRAIGDFRVVGFFKRVRGTRFAAWDSKLFSPLCLALGLGALWVALGA